MMSSRSQFRLMSISREDFLRLLPKVIGGELSAEQVQSDQIISANGVSLRWQNLSPAVFGAIRLPQLKVEISFDCAEDEIQIFLKRFDRIYQRGGG